MSSDDVEYYLQRMKAEIEQAEAATDASVAAVHYELAREYAELVAQPELRAKLRIVH